VTTPAWILLALAAVAAFANWWSRVTEHRPTELWSKPLALAALIGVAVALEPADPTVRAWFVVGLVASLAGDVFLLDGDRWFLAGLGSFLLGHVAYVIGFVLAEPWRWWSALAVLPVLLAVAVVVGRRIVAGAGERSGALRIPVTAYLGIISLMVVTAAGAGNAWAVAGAFAFLVSDAVLGWRMFVDDRRWMGPTVMVTYHLAQVGLVLSLLPG
jgi:uncharacterized membrane protein YhhN